MKKYESNKTNQTTNPRYSGVSRIVICEVRTINDNSGAITGLGTLAIAFFTLTLWITSVKQDELTRNSIAIATQEFISTHRPKIIVRNIRTIGYVVEGINVSVGFYAMNIGDSLATINSIQALIIIEPLSKKIEKDLTLHVCDINKTEVVSGDWAIATTNSTVPLSRGEEAAIKNRELSLKVVGVVDYRDGNDSRRLTGFVRVYNEKTKRFEKMDDEEYDYEY